MEYYKILGVSRNATQEEIKRAYRDLAKTHHPDTGGDPYAFKSIQKAYSVLKDPVARQRYDNLFSSRDSTESFDEAESVKNNEESVKYESHTNVHSDKENARKNSSSKEQNINIGIISSIIIVVIIAISVAHEDARSGDSANNTYNNETEQFENSQITLNENNSSLAKIIELNHMNNGMNGTLHNTSDFEMGIKSIKLTFLNNSDQVVDEDRRFFDNQSLGSREMATFEIPTRLDSAAYSRIMWEVDYTNLEEEEQSVNEEQINKEDIDIVAEDLNYSDGYVYGRVHNKSDIYVGRATIKLTFYDQSGNIVDVEESNFSHRGLGLNKSEVFEVSTMIDEEEFHKIESEVIVEDTKDSIDQEYTGIEIVTEDLNYSDGYVYGKVHNKSEEQVSMATIKLIFHDETGDIVGLEDSYFTHRGLGLNQSDVFEISTMIDKEDYDYIESEVIVSEIE